MRIGPSFEARETAERGDAPRPGMGLLSTETGVVSSWDEVRQFAFSGDGGWLARLLYTPEEAEDAAGEGDDPEEPQQDEGERIRGTPGTDLILLDLSTEEEVEIPQVAGFSFDESGEWLAYVVAAGDGTGDGIYLKNLREDGPALELEAGSFVQIQSLRWWEKGNRLAWVTAEENPEGDAGPGSLSYWDGQEVHSVVGPDDLQDGWILPASNTLRWSRDGSHLFYGTRPRNQAEEEMLRGQPEVPHAGEGETQGAPEEEFDPYDFEAILEDTGVDVWHTHDPMINSNQKLVWENLQNRTFAAVLHVPSGRTVQLGDPTVQLRGSPENEKWALGTSDLPYQKQRTWEGGAEDVFLLDMETGDRVRIAERVRGGGSAANSWVGVSGPSMAQSPGGRYAVWFQEDHWHLFDAEDQSARNLTEGLDVPFFDVDHDFPNPRGGHGLGGWLEGDEAVLIHDKYDLWRFPVDGGDPVNLTGAEGRRRGLVLRVLRVDPDQVAFNESESLHLASFDENDKSFGFYQTHPVRGGLRVLLDEEKKFRFIGKAEDADRLLFVREDYDEFPDLWVSDLDFGRPERVTDVNPGLLDRFAWGTSELVEWTSDDGIPLQGVVIKPGNYEPGKRYPVLTYFYRFFSQRLHEFNQPVINHRPSFPIYASDGYIVFLPDVRFEVGRPGISSLKSVVPGLKRLVDMGLADPDALGLHGHSWSGYTTAYIVTQTNIFAAAVAGAPVSNMTSAYGGIRWGSGLARQFQYEAGQSRLSGSLWEARPDYIENSPLFYADRVETPLVLMHGDEDEAVPWYQSIELYLALRRTGKRAVFLQYRGEPHHPRQYSNKLDYSMKMKAFFDHYLKGAPAPAWWAEGVLYSGK